MKKTITLTVTEKENEFLMTTPDGGRPTRVVLTRKGWNVNTDRKRAWAWDALSGWRITTASKRPSSLKRLLKNGTVELKVDVERVKSIVKMWAEWKRWEYLKKNEKTEILLQPGEYAVVDPCYLNKKIELKGERSEYYLASELVGGGAVFHMRDGDGRYCVESTGTGEIIGSCGVDSGDLAVVPAENYELSEDSLGAAFVILNLNKVIIGNGKAIFVGRNDDFVLYM